jgi:hypothetical protein
MQQQQQRLSLKNLFSLKNFGGGGGGEFLKKRRKSPNEKPVLFSSSISFGEKIVSLSVGS